MAQNLLKLENQDKTYQKTDWFEVLPAELQSDVDRTSQLFIARFALGVMFQVVLANEAGAAGFTPRILVPNAIAGEADITLISFTALTADGTVLLVLYPSDLNIGTEQLLGTLPREWKFMLDYTTGTPDTDMVDTHVFARYI